MIQILEASFLILEIAPRDHYHGLVSEFMINSFHEIGLCIRIGTGHRLPRHLHVPGQESRLLEKGSPHWRGNVDPAIWSVRRLYALRVPGALNLNPNAARFTFMAHVPVRHPAGDLRSCKSAVLPICHGSTCRVSAQAESQSDTLPWCVRRSAASAK